MITTFFTLMHAAAQEVDEGRLSTEAATQVLTITLLNALAP